MSTNKDIKFSICIPYYNDSEFIEECLLSVINQSYKNWEILIHNDGSDQHNSDYLNNLCSKLQSKNNDIKVFTGSERGPLFSRTSLYKKSNGNVIISVDADDKLNSKDVLQQLNVAFNNNIDACIYNVTRDSSNTKNKNYTCLKANKKGFVDCKNIQRELCCGDQVNNVWNVAIKSSIVKEAIEDKNFDCEKLMFIAEDIYYISFVYDKIKKALLIDKPLYYYRDSPGSLIYNPISQEKIDDQLFIADHLQKCSEKWGISDYDKNKYICEYMIYGDIVYTNKRKVKKEEKYREYDKIANNQSFKNAYERTDKKGLTSYKNIAINKTLSKNYFTLELMFFFINIAKRFK